MIYKLFGFVMLFLVICNFSEAGKLPIKVSVLDFTSLDIIGQERFLDTMNEAIILPNPNNTLGEEDYDSMNEVMQGFVRMIDAYDNLKTNDANREAQIQDNALRLAKALELYNTIIKGESRPMAIGAEYLTAYLNRYNEVFLAVDSSLVIAAMNQLQAESGFPEDFMKKLAQKTGATHLIYGTLADIQTKTTSFEGYGIATKTVTYQLDVIVKMADLVNQQIVYSNVYTGTYREKEGAGSGAIDNNVYQTLMKSALQLAADDLYNLYKPQEKVEGISAQKTIDERAVEATSTSRVTSSTVETMALAVAKPVTKGGVNEQEVEAVWSMLEASVGGGFNVVSRSSLEQMLTEIGLSENSDLINLNSNQRAELGKIKGVQYLLVPSISKFGSRLNLSLMVVDASTGEIDQDMRTSGTFTSLDDIADRLQDTLNEIGLGREAKKYGRSAILSPIIKIAKAPSYLAEEFNVSLENMLIENQIKLQNLQSVSKILDKNNIGNLNEVEPAMYVRVGELLRVDYLLQATINRFSYEKTEQYIKASKRTVVTVTGNVAGNIRIISAQTGEIVGSIPLRVKVDFDDLDSSETEDWAPEDYGRYMIEAILPTISEKIIAKIK